MGDNFFDTIQEIAIRNELPILQVARVYTGLNLRVRTRNLINGNRLNSAYLDKAAYKLTEKTIDNRKAEQYFRFEKLK